MDTEIPKWFKKIFYDRRHHGILSLNDNIKSLFDHVYVLDNGSVVMEPYSVNPIELMYFLNICQKYHIDVSISGEAKHHEHCFRIMVKKETDIV